MAEEHGKDRPARLVAPDEGAGPEVLGEVIPPLWRKYGIGRHEEA